jgi:hypothetical protein
VGALRQGCDGLVIQRPEGAQVQHGYIQFRNGLERHLLGGAVGDDAGGGAVLAEGRLAQPRRGSLLPLILQAAVEVLVFEKQHRVRVVDGGPEQGVGIPHRTRRHDLQAGTAEKMPLGILAVEGAATIASASGTTEHRGHRGAPAPVGLGGEIHHEIRGQQGEIHELELRHGPLSHQRRADGRARDGLLGNGRVDHPVSAEALQQSFRGPEGAPVGTNVLAQAADAGISLHGVEERLADRFDVGAGEAHASGSKRSRSASHWSLKMLLR